MKPVGVVTRGTTSPRRLRRVDRWLLAAAPALIATPALLAVDLGFGARPVTTVELARRVRAVNPTARVVGLDIDPERVTAAQSTAGDVATFAVGGFELAGLRPHLVRAFNVLRQYDERAVADAWATMLSRLQPGGLLLDGTCDEAGDLGAWITLTGDGPRSLTLAVDLGRAPSAVAARLPKVLISRNMPGEPIHRFLSDLDEAWARAAALSPFGERQRFVAAAAALRTGGWPVVDGPRRWRRGELTVAWAAIRPLSG